MVLEPINSGAVQHLEPSHDEGMAISPAAQAKKAKALARSHD